MLRKNIVDKVLREVIFPVGLNVVIARGVRRPEQEQHKQLLRRQIGRRIERESVVDERNFRADQNAFQVFIRQKARIDRHALLRDGQLHGFLRRHPADGGDHAVFNMERHDCLVAHDKHCGNAVRVRNAAVFAHVTDLAAEHQPRRVFVELLEYRLGVTREAVRRLAVILAEADAAGLDPGIQPQICGVRIVDCAVLVHPTRSLRAVRKFYDVIVVCLDVHPV